MKKILIVGANAKATVLSGGGSATMKPTFFVSPYDGIVSALRKQDESIKVDYCEGARGKGQNTLYVGSFPNNSRSVHADAHTRKRGDNRRRASRMDGLFLLA